ncbi:MAG: LytR/AlgR family response regulator transcription factor [Vicinamibacterales bacterium]
MSSPLRVLIADDERPARSFLKATLTGFEDVQVVGEVASGLEAVEVIQALKPDVAFLDLQMPELSSLDVVRALRRHLPLVAFVTAFDEYAVRAFGLNAIDYLLKPVDPARVRATLDRAKESIERRELSEQSERLRRALSNYEASTRKRYLDRIPVRRRDEIVLVPTAAIASIVAEGELLHLHTLKGERFTITFRLKDLEPQLDPESSSGLGVAAWPASMPSRECISCRVACKSRCSATASR